jgi:hypothetical protein
MRAELKEARDELRDAARATLLAVRSMIDARVRRLEARERETRLRVVDGDPAPGSPAPHEIV